MNTTEEELHKKWQEKQAEAMVAFEKEREARDAAYDSLIIPFETVKWDELDRLKVSGGRQGREILLWSENVGTSNNKIVGRIIIPKILAEALSDDVISCYMDNTAAY